MSVRSRALNYFSAYPSKGKEATVGISSNAQLAVFNARAHNNTSGTNTVGICRKLAPGGYKVFQFATSGSVFTEVTAAVDAGTATNIFSGTNNDGFYIQSKRQIGLIGMTISTGQTGGTFTYKYYNGTTFAVLTTIEVPAYTTTGDIYIVARSPIDAAKGGNAALDSSMYSLQVISTTAPAGAVAITKVWVAEFMDLQVALPANAGLQLSFPTDDPFILQSGETIFPYFGTANAANDIGCYYVTV